MPGPRIAAYAEYDAVPGNCQAAATRKMPRAGLSPHAGGHTDPHSALGISALGGALAAKAAMTELGLKGTIVFFGEPAEKLRLSKPVHAAKGYYDELDAAISFHPTYMLPLVNTARWDTHCGAGYACIYTFECAEPESWLSGDPDSPIPASHVAARAPGATDALFHMFGLTKQTQSNMLPFTQGWSLSEAILTAGQATADNLPAQIAEIQYLWRTPTIEMAEQVARVLDNNAEAAARAAHCTWQQDLGDPIAAGPAQPCVGGGDLPQHRAGRRAAMGRRGDPPGAGDPEGTGPRADGQALSRRLRDDHPADGGGDEAARTTCRRRSSTRPRTTTPNICWHCPTVRFYIARPMLKAPKGFSYPAWAMNALGGLQALHRSDDPHGGQDHRRDHHGPAVQRRAAEERAGRMASSAPAAASAATDWIAPLLPKDFRVPLDFRWPEYVTTPRGEEWWIPTRGEERS